jgi:CDP-4-dehydro-6-deoxyglucose reductase
MSFKMRIEPSGHDLDIAVGETLLDAALRQGFVLPYSCRGGSCGTCKGRLLSGQVDYAGRDTPALSEQEKSQGLTLFCRAQPLSDVVIEAQEISAAKGIVIKTLPCRVVDMQRPAHDVMVLSLKLPQSERLAFLAGQHIDILLRDGLRRSYSLAHAPHDDEFLRIHVRHLPGGLFSGQVFARMQLKDLLRFQGPLGTFFVREESTRPIIFVAGGTGFAPIKAMIEHALYRGSQRPMHLYWGARARRDLYQDDLARAWAQTHTGLRYTPVLSESAPEDAWSGRTGWVHAAVLQDYPDLGAHAVYASGPPPMIEAIKQTFTRQGLPDNALYYDSFDYAHDAS